MPRPLLAHQRRVPRACVPLQRDDRGRARPCRRAVDARARRRQRGQHLVGHGTREAGVATSPTAWPRARSSHATRLLAADLAPRIRVNGIEVGSVATSALDIVVDERRAPHRRWRPPRRCDASVNPRRSRRPRCSSLRRPGPTSPARVLDGRRRHRHARTSTSACPTCEAAAAHHQRAGDTRRDRTTPGATGSEAREVTYRVVQWSTGTRRRSSARAASSPTPRWSWSGVWVSSDAKDGQGRR